LVYLTAPAPGLAGQKAATGTRRQEDRAWGANNATGAPVRDRRALTLDSGGHFDPRFQDGNASHADYFSERSPYGPIRYPFGTEPVPFRTFMQAFGPPGCNGVAAG